MKIRLVSFEADGDGNRTVFDINEIEIHPEKKGGMKKLNDELKRLVSEYELDEIELTFPEGHS